MLGYDLKVSVIIPIYNVEDFLTETIKCVLNQNLIGFELILVNDGSTDKSGQIAKIYSRLDRRVIYLEQENSGVSKARNLGLDQAIGEYVYFLDSDDTIDISFLKTSYETAKSGDFDVVVLGENYEDRLPHPVALPTCAQFWKREFLLEHPLVRFPEGIQPCEDGLFSNQLLAITEKIGFNPNAKYYYREHANQNHRQILKNVENVIVKIPEWFKILKDFYQSNNLYLSRSLHLAKFVEHEPFEFRYIHLPLDNKQKKELFDLIHSFMDENVIPFINDDDKNKLSTPFKKFLSSQNHEEFDEWLGISSDQIIKKRKILLLLSKVIPFSKLRRKARKNILKKYPDWFGK